MLEFSVKELVILAEGGTGYWKMCESYKTETLEKLLYVEKSVHGNV